MKSFFNSFGSIFFITIPIAGLICIIALIGALFELHKDRWLFFFALLFPLILLSSIYTFTKLKISKMLRDKVNEEDKILKLTSVSNFLFILFLFFCFPIITFDISEIVNEAILYTKSKNLNYKKSKFIILNDKNENVNLDIFHADTPEKQGIGMMGLTELRFNQGMYYSLEENELLKFSTKYIKVELEEIVIGDNLEVLEIVETSICKEKKCPVYTSNFKAKKFIEVLKGFTARNYISPGNKIQILD
ncbi:MAG: DUF192 domain-containing protein [Leptospiraceae bacterium]|nr:DUF192 domain-containing protein [Leptospiraceae bacterium]